MELVSGEGQLNAAQETEFLLPAVALTRDYLSETLVSTDLIFKAIS
jgi:hypothetical protein